MNTPNPDSTPTNRPEAQPKHDAPDRIFLQWNGDQEPDDDEPKHEVTWCSERMFSHDVEYVRARHCPQPDGEARRLLEEAENLIGQCLCTLNNNSLCLPRDDEGIKKSWLLLDSTDAAIIRCRHVLGQLRAYLSRTADKEGDGT